MVVQNKYFSILYNNVELRELNLFIEYFVLFRVRLENDKAQLTLKNKVAEVSYCMLRLLVGMMSKSFT